MARPTQPSLRGSALIGATVLFAVLGISAMGLISYLSSEYRRSNSSQRWIQALHVAEAAVDVGSVELNYAHLQSGNGFTTARGWVPVKTGVFRKYMTNMVDADGVPVGNASVIVDMQNMSRVQVIGIGTVTGGISTLPPVTRAVCTLLIKQVKSDYAIVAKDTIQMTGGAIVDSYDSRLGPYNTATNSSANGDIVSLSNKNPAIETSGPIYGTIRTGKSAGVKLGSGGVGPTKVVADRAYTVPVAQSKGWINDDFVEPIPSAKVPDELKALFSGGAISNNTSLPKGDYKFDSVSIGGGKQLIITGAVRMFVTGKFTTSGSGVVIIQPNASLEIYCQDDITLSGSGILNNTLLPANCKLYAVPSFLNKKVTISGGSAWYGVIYAPDSATTISGDGDLYGSIVTNTLVMSGSAKVHYDKALAPGLGDLYDVVSWQSGLMNSGTFVGY